MMTEEKARASAWFRELRDQIVAAFESFEDSQSSGPFAGAEAGAVSIDVGEVAGACFCCSFDELVATADRWDDAPDVLLAEPVGSCTDLVATVIFSAVIFQCWPKLWLFIKCDTDSARCDGPKVWRLAENGG